MKRPKLAVIAQSRPIMVSVTALLVTALAVFAYVRQPTLIKHLDNKLYDLFLGLREPSPPSPIPIIIDIDEASLAAYGQWPWPRFLMAKLIADAVDQGARAVGLDILLSEPDRSSPVRIKSDLKEFLDLDISFAGLPPILEDYDVFLSQVLPEYPAVLGIYLQYRQGERAEPLPPSGVSYLISEVPGDLPPAESLPQSLGGTPPLPIFSAVSNLGCINMNPDQDGVVRRVPLISAYGEQLYAALSLRVLMLAEGVKRLTLEAGPDGLEAIKIGQRRVPVLPDGSLMVPFKGPKKLYTYVSAKDILSGTIDPAQLEGRMAYVGTSAPGLLDLRVTPFDRVYPGVEVHTTIADAILSETYIISPPWTPGAQVLAIFIVGLISAAIFGFTHPRIYVFLGLAMLAGAVGGSIYHFRAGLFISPLYVSLTIVLMGASLLFLRFWQEERQKNFLRRSFARYVDPEVVDRITRRQDVLKGEEVEASIMFTDLRGFTSLSETLTPQDTVSLLNRYFTPMTALVRSRQGTLDKFIGDALMAFWNAPLPVAGHPFKALDTAMSMLETLAEVNVGLKRDYGIELAMGAGIHSGKVYVGNMGSDELMNYTLIGDNVNLASRLEGLCSKYGVGVVTSGETRAAVGGELSFQLLDVLRVKGRRRAVDVYTPVRHEEAERRRDELARYDEARAIYVAGDFARAAAIFEELDAAHRRRLYALYAERSRELQEAPPPDWDGVWTMTSK